LSGLTVSLDNNPIAVGASGFVETSLTTDSAHTFIARATRAGNAVTGTLTILVTTDDINKPLVISLA
jgi:hypothetical protein